MIKAYVEMTRNAIQDLVFFSPQPQLANLLKGGYITVRREDNPRWGFTGYRNLYSIVHKEDA